MTAQQTHRETNKDFHTVVKTAEQESWLHTGPH